MHAWVGRVVHYVPYASAIAGRSRCRAALIIDHDTATPDVVALAVLAPNGLYFDHFVTQNEDHFVGGTWHWPEPVKET